MAKQDISKASKENFYQFVLKKLFNSDIPVLIGGGYAFREYSSIKRETADMDLFCKVADYPKILKTFIDEGFTTAVEDERWIAKIYQEKGSDTHVDLIFNTVNGICPVDDLWFKNSTKSKLFDVNIRLIGPVEYIWGKIFMWDRFRYEGADVNHVILEQGENLNWQYLLQRMEQHWQLLYAQILNFLYVYPSERNKIPIWLIKELTSRINHLLDIPLPETKVCRGPLISQTQYQTEITEWGYKVLTYSTI